MLLNKNTLFSSFNTLFFLLKGKKVLLIAMDKDQDDYAARLIQSVMDDITTHVHKLEIKLLKRIRWTLP